MKNRLIVILVALCAMLTNVAGASPAKRNFDFKAASGASEKREKLKAAVQVAFEKAVVEKYGNEAARTKSGRIALRVTVLESRALKVESHKRRAASIGTPTPDKPESYIYFCDLSMLGEPIACFEMDAKFEPKRDSQIFVYRMKEGKAVDEIEADKSVGMQVLRPANVGSPHKVGTYNPDVISKIRDLDVTLAPELGEQKVEIRTFWHPDFYFPNAETLLIEQIGVLFNICRKDGATDADDKAEFLFGFVPFNGKFPATPMASINEVPLKPAEPSKVGPDPDFSFATLLTVVISAPNYGDIEKSSQGRGLDIEVKGVGDELTFVWFEPFELPPLADLMSCEEPLMN